MARLTDDNLVRARALIELYPQKRSALIPLLHLVQEQDGFLSPEGIEQVAELVDLTPAEVRGTASFYDMFHLEPIGKYLVAVCTNIACLLAGSYELLEHMEQSLRTHPGGTTADGMFTLEDAECLALCGNAPCVTVNWRYFGDVTPDSWDALAQDLRAGKLDAEVPSHGTLCRVRRTAGIRAGLGGSGTETTRPPAGPPVELATSRTTPAVLSTLQPGTKATAATSATGDGITGNGITGNGSDGQ